MAWQHCQKTYVVSFAFEHMFLVWQCCTIVSLHVLSEFLPFAHTLYYNESAFEPVRESSYKGLTQVRIIGSLLLQQITAFLGVGIAGGWRPNITFNVALVREEGIKVPHIWLRYHVTQAYVSTNLWIWNCLNAISYAWSDSCSILARQASTTNTQHNWSNCYVGIPQLGRSSSSANWWSCREVLQHRTYTVITSSQSQIGFTCTSLTVFSAAIFPWLADHVSLSKEICSAKFE